MTPPVQTRLECPGCKARYTLNKELPKSRTYPCKKCGQPLILRDELRLKDAPQTRTWEIPVHLGRYTVEREIARGAMGAVYLARQQGLDRPVAIKMMLSGGASSPDAVRRFEREARSVAKLRHPNIVAVHEIGNYHGMPFFSMDYVKGRALDEELSRSPMPPDRIATLIRDVAIAIHYAHEQGIVHRDLKPGNILIDEEGTPHITDFGLAKVTTDESFLSMTGDVLGTPAYMSPEQAEGKVHELGPPSDIYSLGALLYRMLTGRVPFQGPTIAATLYKVVNEYTVDPLRLNPKIAPELSAICMKALEKECSARYASALDFAEDLDRHLRGEPVLARPISNLQRWKRRILRNRIAFRISAASVAVALIAVIALLFWGGEGTLDLLERHLNSSDARIRTTAMTALMEDLGSGTFTGDERTRAVQLCTDAIQKDSAATLMETVLHLFEKRPVDELSAALTTYLSSDRPVADRCRVLALLEDRKFSEAHEMAAAFLRDPDHRLHQSALSYLRVLPSSHAYAAIGARMADPECGVQAQKALDALYDGGRLTYLVPGAIRAAGPLRKLGAALREHNEEMERAMREFDGPAPEPQDAVEAAIAELKSGEPEGRLRAAIELGRHADSRAAEPLMASLLDVDDAVARASGVALKSCGASVLLERLLPFLDHERPAVRIAAGAALTGTPEAVRALATRLSAETDPEVQAVLQHALQPAAEGSRQEPSPQTP